MSVRTVQGGRFYTDFDSGEPSGCRISGDAMVNPGAGVNDSGMLRLTVPEKDRQGTFIVEDFDAKRKVTGFVVEFKMLIGGGTYRGGDGLSFNFARKLPPTIGEAGVGRGLVVIFDTYKENNGPPEIVVSYQGQELKTVKVGKLRTGNAFVDVQISLANKLLTVTYAGRNVVECEIPKFTPMGGAEFGFGARTGSAMDNHLIDELSITTTVEKGPTPENASVAPEEE